MKALIFFLTSLFLIFAFPISAQNIHRLLEKGEYTKVVEMVMQRKQLQKVDIARQSPLVKTLILLGTKKSPSDQEGLKAIFEKFTMVADVNWESKISKGAPLQYAVQYNLLEEAKTLVARGAKFIPWVPYACVAGKASPEMLEFLMENEVDLHKTNHDGYNALHQAALAGNIPYAGLLLEKGLAIDTPMKEQKRFNDFEGYTPLLLAALNGHTEMVSYLLDQGASISHTAKDGKRAIHLACQTQVGYTVFNRYFSEKGKEKGMFRMRIEKESLGGNHETALLLFEKGADKEVEDNEGNSPIHFAAGNQDIKTVNYLLNQGISPSAQDSTGNDCMASALTNLCRFQQLGFGTVEARPYLKQATAFFAEAHEKYMGDKRRAEAKVLLAVAIDVLSYAAAYSSARIQANHYGYGYANYSTIDKMPAKELKKYYKSLAKDATSLSEQSIGLDQCLYNSDDKSTIEDCLEPNSNLGKLLGQIIQPTDLEIPDEMPVTELPAVEISSEVAKEEEQH